MAKQRSRAKKAVARGNAKRVGGKRPVPAGRSATSERSTSGTSRRGTARAGRSREVPKIRVRMYRQGLGDCFLVTFDVGRNEKHMLIDCGTLGATTTGVKLADVVKDITKVTTGRLALLIATHEHLDHVAAFHQLKDALGAIEVANVWLAWTEDTADPLARKIAKSKDDLGAALAHAAQALTSADASPASAALGNAVGSILGFFDDQTLAAGKFSPTVDDAMDFVRTRRGAKVRYCRPGDGPFEEDWAPGFRFYVLGPPRDEQALYNLGENGSSALYSLAMGLKTGSLLFSSGKPAIAYVQETDLADKSEFAAALPFDTRFRREASSAGTKEMFAGTYLADGAEWRRVDEDWLQVASDLALQLDSATNNTSLALAIERVADGKVLLFPADAQQGNWLSWHDPAMVWAVKDGTQTTKLTATDLLARTVFYKVGHHSSHNATAKAKGLELMKLADELVAFVPVDRAVALKRNPKNSWKMPALALYRRLLEKCGGRVLRSDIGWAADASQAKDKKTEQEFVGMATAAEWRDWEKAQAAARHVSLTPLYADYVLE